MIKYDILNRFSGDVQFTAEIYCDEYETRAFKVGLAVQWAIKNDEDLREANLKDAYLSGANLEDADFRNANLNGANLEGANLETADLRGANLEGANLETAELKETYLEGASLKGAYLRGANIERANLRCANLEDADMTNAYTGGSDFQGANLNGANLENIDFDGAYIENADFGGLVIFEASIRADDVLYRLHTSCLGGCVITDGCKIWVGNDAIEQARAHCKTESDAELRSKTLIILDYFEKELSARNA